MSQLLGLQTGDLFAREFRVVRQLKTGGMGALFVVNQLSTNKHRVLKLLVPALVNHEESRIRFIREARAAAAIDSDHVVEVLTAGIDELTNSPYIVMELLDGQDLGDLIESSGLLTLADVRIIMTHVGHALGKAHELGIIHRDLKPENIFLANSKRTDEKFCTKILDYGVAKILSEAQPHMGTQPVGSPLFMSPEQTDPYGKIGPATDVWALGLLAFYLLTARYYWLGASGDASLPALLREVCFDDLVPPSIRAAFLGVPFTPAGFDAWFARCVDRDPDKRFADGGEAVQAFLDTVRDDHPLRLSAQPPPPSDRPMGLASFRNFERISVKLGEIPSPGVLASSHPPNSFAMFDSAPLFANSSAPPGPKERRSDFSSAPPSHYQAGNLFSVPPTDPSAMVGSGFASSDPFAGAGGMFGPSSSRSPNTRFSAAPPTMMSGDDEDDPFEPSALSFPNPLGPMLSGAPLDSLVSKVPPTLAAHGMEDPVAPPLVSPKDAVSVAKEPAAVRLRRLGKRAAPIAAGLALGALMGLGVAQLGKKKTAQAAPPPVAVSLLFADPQPLSSECPPDAVLIEGAARRFCIDRTEVSVADFSRCLQAGACAAISEPPRIESSRPEVILAKRSLCNLPLELGHHPMNCIEHAGAQAVCAFRSGRLPAESEWRQAARADETKGGLPFDGVETGLHTNLCRAECTEWGDENGVFIGSKLFGDIDPFQGTMPSGAMTKGASPEGVYDLAGNVSEWIEDEVVGGRLALGSNFMTGQSSSGLELMVVPQGAASIEIGFRCVYDPATD